jgi:hypothetical protein
MTSSRRRLAALVIAPLLVVGLAACAGVEPEAMPTPTPTPTPTPIETVAAPTMPTSRVPATCDELFASSLVSGGVASAYAGPSAQQAGYLGCMYEGKLGGTSATLLIDVSVDPPIDELNRVLGRSDVPGSFYCADDAGAGACDATFVSASYVVDLWVFDFTGSSGSLTPLFEEFMAEVEQRVASWPAPAPAPAPAWQAPSDALRWAFDCAELLPRQDVVRDVIPFAVGDAYRAGGGLNYMYFWSMVETDMTQCVWDTTGAGVTLEILPGGAWAYEAGIPLTGEPYVIPGALDAARYTQYGRSHVSAYIDGSLVTVTVFPPEGSGIDGYAVAEDVIAALVAAF